MIGLQNQPMFLWKHGPFASQLVGLYSLNVQMKEEEKRTIQIQCPIVGKREKQIQWNFSMGVEAPLHAILAMAADPVPPSYLPFAPEPAPTTEMAVCLCKHDSMHTTNTSVETAPTSTLKHDNGHIHCASPICGLPPEHPAPKNKGFDRHADLQTTPRGKLVDKRATTLASTQGNQDTDGNTFGQIHEVRKGPATVLYAIDERPDYHV